MTVEIRVRPQGTESDQECCVSAALSMSTGRLEPQDETENVSGVFYDYSERSSLSSPPAERPDGEKKRKSLTCPDVLDGSLQAAVIWQTLV